MAAEDPRKNAKRLVLLVWILVAFFYFYLSIDYIRVEMNDDKLVDYVRYVVQLGGSENRNAREIRALLLVKADELGIPLKSSEIQIQGSGQNLKIALAYEMDIDIPIFKRGFYHKRYEHNLSYRQPR
jgi:hypothetical protein